MRPDLVVPPPVAPGDRVAVVSPAYAAPGAFPHVHERAMQRLRDDLGLVPVEYPTTRQLGASPAERAHDLVAALADPTVRAVLATIGGDDLITVVPLLDPAVVRADPKPFLGYSDGTNLLAWLWDCGVVGYHGGSTMVHLGRAGGLHPVSARSLRAALFDRGDLELHPVDAFSEDEQDWGDPASLDRPAPLLPSPGWTWHRPTTALTGPTWGGNLEILHWMAAADRLRPVDDLAGCVLLLETSEEMPSAVEVFRMLRNLGERGLLAQFPAVVVGLAKATALDAPRPLPERQRYRDDQREAVLDALARYAPDATVVLDVDLGHTDPQWVLPYGGAVTVDGPARRLVAHF